MSASVLSRRGWPWGWGGSGFRVQGSGLRTRPRRSPRTRPRFDLERRRTAASGSDFDSYAYSNEDKDEHAPPSSLRSFILSHFASAFCEVHESRNQALGLLGRVSRPGVRPCLPRSRRRAWLHDLADRVRRASRAPSGRRRRWLPRPSPTSRSGAGRGGRPSTRRTSSPPRGASLDRLKPPFQVWSSRALSCGPVGAGRAAQVLRADPGPVRCGRLDLRDVQHAG